MKEGKFEKIKANKIQAFIEGKIQKSEGDPTPSPLRMVDSEQLIPEAEELFRLFKAGELEAAQVKVQEIKEKIEKIKDSKKRNSNESFVQFFDHEIEKQLENKQTKEFNEQDNT